MAADAAVLAAYHLADEQGNSSRVETQFLLQVAVYLPDRLLPLLVVSVRLALMKQDALDDAIVSGHLGHRQQPLIGVSPVLVEDVVHPVAVFAGDDAGVLVFVEERYGTALNGHRHDADADIFGHRFEQRPSEPVGWAEVGISSAEWWHGLAPCAKLTVRAVGGGHAEKAVAYRQVLLLDGRLSRHVRLPEAEEDPEVMVFHL